MIRFVLKLENTASLLLALRKQKKEMKLAPVLSLIGTITGRQIQIESDSDEKHIDISTIRSKDKSQSDVIHTRLQPTAVDVR